MDHRALILFAHPQLHKSRVNRLMIAEARGLAGVTVHDLYGTYPDFNIDVEREQAQLLAHELVLFHHPLYWYSSPAIIKEWLDATLERGWAYGEGGTRLQGKHCMMAVSTGGPVPAYHADGYNRFALEDFLLPFEQTAHLCGMHWHPPLAFQGAFHQDSETLEQHAVRYRRLLEAFVQRGPAALDDPSLRR